MIVPLAVIDLAPDVANQAYAEKLLLVRPDQHIAWRGQALPDNPKALIARVTGAAGVDVATPVAAVPA